ncbi:ABC transporter substrate-binding protein [Streptomyces bohaiensis]|uniref:Iron-siderophore ABC transporter substrate-binding protein n=1 Tax=Streptomyces bohaiensis TaxID=1431344 RepID=A0ABX1CJ10_9ACTN|nr:iron-siderophore ABC transporter substrate-binding protein [Streptomyces bohaiensis]NJQ16504.1 iron-siderophore ABC transporter substrate-binding protein [Streptomyces bohaiensis]
MQRMLRALATAGTAAALALTVAACGSGTVGEEAGGSDSASPDSGAGGGTITVETARGQVTLDEPATTVVSLEWTYTEELIALGVQPAGNADNDGYAQWITAPGVELAEDTVDVGNRQAPSIEQIRQLEPDLIVVDDGRAQENLPQLQDIAPVLSFEYTTSPQLETLRTNFTELAKAVGREEQADEVFAGIEESAADLEERLAAAGLDGTRYAFAQGFTADGTGTARLFTDEALVAQVLELAGLENTWDGEGDAWGMTTVGVEGLTNLEPDIHFLTVADDADSPFTGAFAGNRVWEGLEFVQEDRWHELDPGTWLFGGPVSAEYILDEVGKALGV